MPAGVDTTLPEPAPARLTVKAKVLVVKVAVTARAALIVTLQVDVPLQSPPDHPVKVVDASGDAVSVTTVPPPEPVLETVRANGAFAKVAVTARATLIVTVHAPLPAHAPDQPVKTDVEAGAALSVTTAPEP